jgi:hypothetical protein
MCYVQVSRTPASRNRPRAPMRRPRSAKARNRGPEEARFRRRDLWGFEACERQFSRGRNYERAALWRVARSRGAYAAGIGIRFGVAAAIVRRYRRRKQARERAALQGEVGIVGPHHCPRARLHAPITSRAGRGRAVPGGDGGDHWGAFARCASPPLRQSKLARFKPEIARACHSRQKTSQ